MAVATDAAELGREWRERMQGDIAALLKATQENTAAIAALQKVAEAHQDRLAKLESSPATARSWLNIVIAAGGCLGMTVAALISVASIIVTVVVFGHH